MGYIRQNLIFIFTLYALYYGMGKTKKGDLLMYSVRLRELRKEFRYTLDDIAKKLDIARSTYAGYETGHRKPSLETLSQLATIYNVSTDYILGLTNERDPKKVEYNASEYLKKEDLNWNGIPLSDEELKPIRDLLEVIVRDRIPNKK